MASFKILCITERFAASALCELKNIAVLKEQNWQILTGEIHPETEILLIRTGTKIRSEILAKLPNLRLVVTATAGFDHIDLKLCQKRGVRVAHCPTAHSASAAELTWGLVLACSRRLIEANQAVKRGDWAREKLVGHELAGKTYGIVGLGRIGQRVTRIAQSFDMHVMAFDPYQEDEVFSRFCLARSGLEEMLRSADIVSLHVPLTKETHHMIGELALEGLNERAILINTSRGSVIHEPALLNALSQKKVGAVGLDVFEVEPLNRESAFFQYPNVIMTPHVGATTEEALVKASMEAAKKVTQYLNHGTIEDELPPSAPWYIAP